MIVVSFTYYAHKFINQMTTSHVTPTSRTHHRNGEFLTFSRIPKASGKNLVQAALSGAVSDTVAEDVSDIFD